VAHPAHHLNDFGAGRCHNVPKDQVIHDTARMTLAAQQALALSPPPWRCRLLEAKLKQAHGPL
jgi:hypothetical protein